MKPKSNTKMSNETKESINWWSTLGMRISVGIIAFLLMSYWNDFKDVKQEVTNTKILVQELLSEDKLFKLRFLNLENKVEKHDKAIDKLRFPE